MMNKDWIIRRANLTDIDALEQCGAESCSKNGIVDYRKEIMEHPVWIAEYNNQLIGCLVLHLTKEAVHVEHVLLTRKYREQGLGRSLMTFAENEAVKRNCEAVIVSLDSAHKQDLSLYEHLGWKQSNSDNGNIIMSKQVKELAAEV